MRSFKLYRRQDVSGTSSTGYIAIGHMNSNGYICVEWIVETRLADGSTKKIKTITNFESLIDMILLYDHCARTVLIWDDTGEIVSDLDILTGTKAA